MILRSAALCTAMFGVITAGALSAASAAAHGAGPATPAGCLKVQALAVPAQQQAMALRYWTPARIRAAREFSPAALGELARSRRSPAAQPPAPATQCIPGAALGTGAAPAAPLAAAPASSPAAAAHDGYPTIGKLTFKANGILALNCTATVIQGTPARNREELILTAAHCIEGTFAGIVYHSTGLVFSPMWHDNRNPYGTWTARKVFLGSGWMTCTSPVTCTTDPLKDYAVIVLNPKNGKGIGDITGADGWSVNQPGNLRNVTIAAIPATSSRTLTVTTQTVTVTKSGHRYRQAATPGFTDGSSGGPWLEHFSAATGRGVLAGDTGGFEQGGPASGSPSYSDYWTRDFAAVVMAAVKYEG